MVASKTVIITLIKRNEFFFKKILSFFLIYILTPQWQMVLWLFIPVSSENLKSYSTIIWQKNSILYLFHSRRIRRPYAMSALICKLKWVSLSAWLDTGRFKTQNRQHAPEWLISHDKERDCVGKPFGMKHNKANASLI